MDGRWSSYLLPAPKKGTPEGYPGAELDESELQALEQTIDGFFDSWLRGRVDQNTRTLKNTPVVNLLERKGTYKRVTVTPLQSEPFIVSAFVTVELQGVDTTFEYQLEIGRENDNFVVKKVFVGG